MHNTSTALSDRLEARPLSSSTKAARPERFQLAVLSALPDGTCIGKSILDRSTSRIPPASSPFAAIQLRRAASFAPRSHHSGRAPSRTVVEVSLSSVRFQAIGETPTIALNAFMKPGWLS